MARYYHEGLHDMDRESPKQGLEARMSRLRTRFWVESLSALLCAILTILTLAVPDWLEVLGWDPDFHNGSVEWAITAAFGLLTIALALLARYEWRRRPEPA